MLERGEDSASRCHSLLWQLPHHFGELTVPPHRSGGTSDSGRCPHPFLKEQISQLQLTSYLLYEMFDCICVFPKTNIWFQTSVLLNHVGIFLQRGCVLLFAILHQTPHCGSFTNLIRCKDVGLLKGGLPDFFTW